MTPIHDRSARGRPVVLEVESVTVRRGNTVACDAVTLDVGEGETLALLGPSGSGKTSLLRAIAGLEPVAAGSLRFGGRDLAGVPPSRRDFGVMFQDLALFPHRDVLGNVGYGLEVRNVGRAARRAQALALIAELGLVGKEHRRVGELSGGERQRVALARALAVTPRLVLLDEPLGALDRQLRERLAGDLRTTLHQRNLPAIVVTHDHDEAFALADRIALMRSGRVVQSGNPADVWARPVDEWVSDFVGHAPAVDAVVEGSVVHGPWGAVAGPRSWPAGVVRLVVPSAAVGIDDDGPWCGVVGSVRAQRDQVRVEVMGEGGARLTVLADTAPELGAELRLRVGSERLILFGR